MTQFSLVSIIIPCYNGADLMRETINSALRQSYPCIEIIIIDDGSTDNSAEIAQAYAQEHQNVSLVQKENGGLSSARNLGIKVAKGQYVAFLDADDIWHEDKVAKHVFHFQNDSAKAHPLLGVSYSATRFIDISGNHLSHSRHPKCKDIDDYYLYCRNPITNGSNAVFRKEIFDAIQFDETLPRNQDIDCWLRIAFAGPTQWRFEGIDEELTYYRVNSQGLSADYTPHYQCCQRTWEKSFSYANEVATKYAAIAEAFQLRFYARRSIGAGDFKSARKYTKLALAKSPMILIKEPVSTFATICAALCCLKI